MIAVDVTEQHQCTCIVLRDKGHESIVLVNYSICNRYKLAVMQVLVWLDKRVLTRSRIAKSFLLQYITMLHARSQFCHYASPLTFDSARTASHFGLKGSDSQTDRTKSCNGCSTHASIRHLGRRQGLNASQVHALHTSPRHQSSATFQSHVECHGSCPRSARPRSLSLMTLVWS